MDVHLANTFENDNGKWGNSWLQKITPLTSKTPFMMTIGNHESMYDRKMIHYMTRFRMPQYENSQNMYYSFDINNVHVVSMNSVIFNDQNKKWIPKFEKFLLTDLKKTNKKWKIVYMHHPLYCSMPDTPDFRCDKGAEMLRKNLENILAFFKVDLIIAGHVHWYERSFPVFQSHIDKSSASLDLKTFTNPKYPIHLVCGTGGPSEGVATSTSETSPKRPYAVELIGVAGVCELVINGDKSLDMRFINTQGNTMDNFSIIKTDKVKKN